MGPRLEIEKRGYEILCECCKSSNGSITNSIPGGLPVATDETAASIIANSTKSVLFIVDMLIYVTVCYVLCICVVCFVLSFYLF